ncbi:MAG: 2-amino-4-hydroxy-6-hydroxymethyldihydropteridine diphosphokinase [Caldiserica bacterium]|nr:2-amino-4-hydroxy-6-hydroxymethyldihydropteridine diphosphokinase [Caldisericota bacterium]
MGAPLPGEKVRIFLSLGSNVGDKETNLSRCRAILQREGIKIRKTSSLYLTPPWGKTDQPEFLNQVIEAETALSPRELLFLIKSIERKMGRESREKWGPRIIDIDILFYGDKIIEEENLVIPHPLIAERAFVLLPLHEIAPELLHPGRKEKIKDLLQQVDTKGIRQLLPAYNQGKQLGPP